MKKSYLLKILTMDDSEAKAFEAFGIKIETLGGSQTQVDFLAELTDEQAEKIKKLPGLIRINQRNPHPV